METNPTIDQAVDYFNAHTVELYPDARDRVAHTIIDICSGEGSTVRFYNSAEEEFLKVRTDRVSDLYQQLFDEKLMGVRHAENGRLYAILADTDPDKGESGTREEPVDVLPFSDVQVGPDCEFGRRISAVAVEYGPAAVTVSLMAPFAEMVMASRPYADGEADELF
ncbi:hypothetical protein [Actinomyces naeslundii]|uniref:hypothetical protein n=1 Tax=Actinomyces naeslundii TaxID=1655 RepID=UPI003C6F57A3